MKIASIIAVSVAGVLISLASLQAAPVESVESSAAKPALQKINSFIGEKAVAAQLSKLGVSSDQIQARLAKLDDAQLTQVASQIDGMKTGGDIQAGYPHPLGPIGCVLQQIHCTVVHFIQILFCWSDVK